mmetsp:Transcript_104738/g.186326  ORF Transcript_104738/g.186326 Transcript_104738/m.186326 type:complete len:232 (-) Transcript_104738:442-1137(-)
MASRSTRRPSRSMASMSCSTFGMTEMGPTSAAGGLGRRSAEIKSGLIIQRKPRHRPSAAGRCRMMVLWTTPSFCSQSQQVHQRSIRLRPHIRIRNMQRMRTISSLHHIRHLHHTQRRQRHHHMAMLHLLDMGCRQRMGMACRRPATATLRQQRDIVKISSDMQRTQKRDKTRMRSAQRIRRRDERRSRRGRRKKLTREGRRLQSRRRKQKKRGKKSSKLPWPSGGLSRRSG